MRDEANFKRAEEGVLGSMMIEARAIRIAMDLLRPEFFYQTKFRNIFSMITALHKAGVGVDVITILDKIRSGDLDIAPAEISQIIENTPTAGHVEYYCKIVAGKHYEREIVRSAREMALSQTAGNLDAIRGLVLAKEGLGAPITFDYRTGLFDLVSDIQKEKTGKIYQTGYSMIDSSWLGTRVGEVNTWGAAPGVGKSIVLLNLMNKAARSGAKCLYVGTEMSAIETTHRHLSIASGVMPWKLRVPKRLTAHDIKTLEDTVAEKLYEMPIHILDDPEPNLQQIESAINNIKPEIVFLDYLERFDLPRAESMRLRVKEFMRKIKTLARTRNVVIHLASQLSRAVYGTEERRPRLSDLSESSAIEKESDRVTLFWKPKEKQVPGAAVLEFILAKSRHGQTGLIWDMEIAENLQLNERRPNYGGE